MPENKTAEWHEAAAIEPIVNFISHHAASALNNKRLAYQETEHCRVCDAPIECYELCERCAEGNDPFFTSKRSGDYDR